MPSSNHNELIQLIQDFAQDLGDNVEIDDYAHYLVRLLKEIELDHLHGNEDNVIPFRRLLNSLGSEIQERLNSGEWVDVDRN